MKFLMEGDMQKGVVGENREVTYRNSMESKTSTLINIVVERFGGDISNSCGMSFQCNLCLC